MILTAKQVLDELMKGKPLSVIRIGDGEGITLNATSSFANLDLCSTAVMRRQMGYNPSIEHIKEIRNNLIKAYEAADIIGIPAHTQKTSSHWTSVKEVLDTNVPVHTDK